MAGEVTGLCHVCHALRGLIIFLVTLNLDVAPSFRFAHHHVPNARRQLESIWLILSASIFRLVEHNASPFVEQILDTLGGIMRHLPGGTLP